VGVPVTRLPALVLVSMARLPVVVPMAGLPMRLSALVVAAGAPTRVPVVRVVHVPVAWVGAAGGRRGC